MYFIRCQVLGVCICNHINKKTNTNWKTYNLGNIGGSNWVSIRATTIWTYLDYIRFAFTATTTNHIKIGIIGVDVNISLNKCTTIQHKYKKNNNKFWIQQIIIHWFNLKYSKHIQIIL